MLFERKWTIAMLQMRSLKMRDFGLLSYAIFMSSGTCLGLLLFPSMGD